MPPINQPEVRCSLPSASTVPVPNSLPTMRSVPVENGTSELDVAAANAYVEWRVKNVVGEAGIFSQTSVPRKVPSRDSALASVVNCDIATKIVRAVKWTRIGFLRRESVCNQADDHNRLRCHKAGSQNICCIKLERATVNFCASCPRIANSTLLLWEIKLSNAVEIQGHGDASFAGI